MKSKKILSLVMAGTLAMSLAAPAFASTVSADAEPSASIGNMTTNFAGTYTSPDIDVVVPQTGNVYLNPYGLAAVATKSDGSKVALSGEIMSVPMAIKNRSTSYLNIGASVTATVSDTSGVRVNATSTDGTGGDPTDEGYIAPATGKAAFIQLEVVQAPANVVGTDIGSGNDADAAAQDAADNLADLNDLIIDASAVEANWANAGTVVAGTRDAGVGTNLSVMKPAEMESDGSFKAYKPGSIALVRVSGDCTDGSSRDPWANTDTFAVSVTFTFAPAQPTPETITAGDMTKTGTADVAKAMVFKVDGTAVTEARPGTTVTVEVTTDHKDDNIKWTVVDADGADIAGLTDHVNVTAGDSANTTTRTFTFTMPYQPVTVKVESNNANYT